jgi:hypothetical protein
MPREGRRKKHKKGVVRLFEQPFGLVNILFCVEAYM